MIMNRNFRPRGGSRNTGGCKYRTKPKDSRASFGHDCNYNDTTFYSPLFLAVHNGKLKLTHSLLGEHSLKDEVSGKKLIHIAAARGHEQIICLLCKRNAEINQGDKDGNTPLHLAVKGNHTDVVNLLLNEATENLKNNRGATPLHIATEIGNLLFVDLILKSGAEVDEIDDDGKTPLHISAGKLHPNIEIIMALLTHGASIHSSCNKGYSPLHYVTTSGSVKITEVLIDRGASSTSKDINGISPLCLAIQKGKTEMVEYILKNKTDVDNKITGRMMPLHFSAQTGNTEIAKLLVTGRDAHKVNAKGEGSKTPLHFSAANGNVEVLKHLILCGAEIESKTAEGDTPLHLSAIAGNLEIISELLNHSAMIDSFNNAGFTPLCLATKNRKKEVVRLLLVKGASATHDRNPREDLDLHILLSVETQAIDVMPAFHIAAKGGDEEIVKIFLENGVDVDLNSKNDKTALHFAALCGHRKVVEELLKAGAAVNSLTKFSETPLHLAAASGRVSTVEFLLDSGARILSTEKGYTPLHYALDRERHHAPINSRNDQRMSRNSGLDYDSPKEVLVSSFWFFKYLRITEMLLIKGASSESRTYRGNSPLDYALKIMVSEEDHSRPSPHSWRKSNTYEKKASNGEFRPEIVRCLLNYGAKIIHSSGLREKDLFFSRAIELKRSTMLDVLLEYDTDNALDYSNVLNLAQNRKNLNIIIALADKISDIETLADSLCNFGTPHRRILSIFRSIPPTESREKDVLKLLIAILVKMRSTSQTADVIQPTELKFLESVELVEWYTECELELMNTRERKIHQQFDITFYDILTKPVSQLARYARNESLMQILNSGTCKQFEAYALCLQRNIEKGRERKALIDLSTECFFTLIRQYCKVQIPSLIVDKIFEYFSVIDLRKLSATIQKKPYQSDYYKGSSYGCRNARRK